MKKWEYILSIARSNTVTTEAQHRNNLETWLNEMGKKGWEAFMCMDDFILLKREKTDD